MVKSSVCSRRSKQSPKKNQKSRKTVQTRGRKKRSISPRKSNGPGKFIINEFTSMTLNSQNKVINMANPGEDVLPSLELPIENDVDSIVILDDTIVPEINNSNLNESCFIIDVNPNADNDGEKSFYKYQDVRTDERLEVTPSSSHCTLDKDNKTGSDISKGTTLISNDYSFFSTNSIDDFNASSCNESLNDYEMNKTVPISSVNENQNDNDTLNYNSVLNKVNKRSYTNSVKNRLWKEYKKINEARQEKLRNKLSKSPDDFNASSCSESLNDYEMNETIPISSVNENQNDNDTLNYNSVLNKVNKRNTNPVKNRLWKEYKKINEARQKQLRNNLSKSPKIKTAQHLASRRIINKENLSDKNQIKNDSIICIDNESDSDVEFVEAFNPSEKLIELSDDDNDSVLCEDINVPLPLIIPIPKRKININKRKKSAKRNNDINSNKVTQQSLNNPDEDDEENSDDEYDMQPASLKRKNRKQINRKKRLKAAKEVASKTKILSDPHLLRPIVIDGCNVALGHSRVGKLSVEGLQICYDYFHSRGHDVKIFLPNSRKFHCMTTNVPLLIEMERKGIVIFTPGRTVNGMGINSYDDRFILEYASLKGAIVISRDYYRDLYDEKEEFRETIRKRLLQYTFVDDLIMFPDDPLGRTGPKLEEFLRFSPEEMNQIASTSK